MDPIDGSLAATQGREAPTESVWTNLTLSLVLLAPGQLSLAAGVARADGLSQPESEKAKTFRIARFLSEKLSGLNP